MNPIKILFGLFVATKSPSDKLSEFNYFKTDSLIKAATPGSRLDPSPKMTLFMISFMCYVVSLFKYKKETDAVCDLNAKYGAH